MSIFGTKDSKLEFSSDRKFEHCFPNDGARSIPQATRNTVVFSYQRIERIENLLRRMKLSYHYCRSHSNENSMK